MSDWFIQKSGFSSDSVLGPLTSEQVIALFLRGEIKKKTPIASQQHTGNEWKMFGKTVLLKQAQEAAQRQKEQKEQATAELKKKQEEEKLQLQQLREQEQIVVADRQQPVAAQPLPAAAPPLPTAVQVAAAVPPANSQFPAGQSTYRKAVSKRFESSNSILDVFDWKFERYVTPLIIRITWIIVVAGFLCAFVYFMIGPEVWASIGSGSSSSTPGTGFRIPDWMIIIAVRVVQAMTMVIMLLWIRVILESMIVIFNIARGISNIEKNTGSD